MRWDVYNYNGSSYTLDVKNWNMTVFVEGEELLVTNPQVVAEVMTLGKKVER